MIDTQEILFFQTVAKCGSFLAASHELNYAQSNISTKIHQLEQKIQAPLFYRHNRGVTLTPKGEILLQYTEQIVKLLCDAETAMKDTETANGSLSIGALETIAQTHLPRVLSAYHKSCPNVQISIRTGISTDLINSVLERELDAAFIAGPVSHPELEYQPFTKEKLLLAAPFGIRSIAELDLENNTLLVFPYGCYYRSLLERLLQDYNITPKGILEFNSIGSLVSSLYAGLGIALLPESILNSHEGCNGISVLELPDKYSSVMTNLVYRKDSYMTTAFSKFVQNF